MLSEVPERMSKLTTLGVLRLSTNQLSEIPSVVLQSYTNVQLLDLSRNSFTEIPNGSAILF